MGEIIDFKTEKRMTNQDYVPFSKDEDYDYELARNIQKKIADIKVVNDPTRKQIAENLGLILEEFGRELNRAELMEKALGTTYIKASERLSKFQIRPNSEISESKLKFLSHRLHDYVKISNAAADILGKTQSNFFLRLFKNTKFVNSDGKDSAPSKPEVLISDLLNKAADLFIKKYDLSEYFKLCDEYGVTREIEKDKQNYNFKVDHDFHNTSYASDYPNQFIYDYAPFLKLTSIIHSKTTCKFISHYLDKNKNIKEEIQNERILGAIENVLIGILPSGKNYNSKLVLLSYPSLALLPGTKKTSNKRIDIKTKKKVPIYDNLPLKKFNIIPKEYGTIKKRQFFINFLSKNKLYEKLIINKKNKLNLEWMDKYLDSKVTQNMNKFKGKSSSHFPYRILPLDKNSILELFDFSLEKILYGDSTVLKPRYDTSRAISPPYSMLAQLEINLFFEGYHLTFDDSMENHWKGSPIPNWEYDSDGNIIDHGDIEPGKYDSTIIEFLEEEIKKSVFGFKKWRKEIENDIRELAEKKIRDIDSDINNLKRKKTKNI